MSEFRSVCLYHNGNRQIVDYYQKKLSHLTFSGNWANATDPDPQGKLWEICYADVTRENLIKANALGIHVLRHVSTYTSDRQNLLQECSPMNHYDWLNYVVCNNLTFCDEIISDISFNDQLLDQTVIITTGRTANSHFREFLNLSGNNAIEVSKKVNDDLLTSKFAILMWREDHWEALTSMWFALQTNQWIHQVNQQVNGNTSCCVAKISQDWIDNNWINACQFVFDCVCFFKLVLKRPISLMTTERAINEFRSSHSKINYDKSTLIEDYNQTKDSYYNSITYKSIDNMYSRIKTLIPTWKINNENIII